MADRHRPGEFAIIDGNQSGVFCHCCLSTTTEPEFPDDLC